MILAEISDHLIGYAQANGGRFRRNHATAEVIVGVLARHAGRGVGAALLASLERWAISRQIHRLELTVMADNIRAIGLYQKMGFIEEGTRHQCLVVGGEFVSELFMAKLITL